jgi:hypothetical protein
VAHAVLAMARNREGGGYVAMKTTVEGAKDEIDVGDQEEPGEWGCGWAKLIGRSVTWKPPGATQTTPMALASPPHH